MAGLPPRSVRLDEAGTVTLCEVPTVVVPVPLSAPRVTLTWFEAG